jgi:phage pi2 protein 07
MPKEERVEPGQVHPRFWERTVREAFQNDPLRILIELIKNSADSYTRLEKRGEAKPPFKILIEICCKRRKSPSVKIMDFAEGMDSQKLMEALKYGSQTSMGEDTEAITSGEKGIGLKDAMMALENNWLITIKDGLINERNKHADFSTGIGKEDQLVTERERNELGIMNNGTVVMGDLPEYFRDRKFFTIKEHLEKHFLMRKLLQRPEYEIYLIDELGNKFRLQYKPPDIVEQLLKEEFKVSYKGNDYKISFTVNKAKKELEQGKPYGESGLLFYYGLYSVLDFTLGRYERDGSFSRIFGEVKMDIGKLVRDSSEAPLVDEKRRGLDMSHPFNRILMSEINSRLKIIEEKEEALEYSFDSASKKEVIAELNKIYKDIKGKGEPPKPPIEPDIFAFHPPHVYIREYEPKTVFLIINSAIVQDEFEIILQTTNSEIKSRPKDIKIQKEEIVEKFIIKRIELYSEKSGGKAEIIATSNNPKYSTKIGVDVLENPMFSPRNGFAFIPDKTTIVDGGKKKVDLIMDKNLVSNGLKIIRFTSEEPIICPGKWELPDEKNLERNLIRNIIRLEIPIEVKGQGHIGEKAIISAFYGNVSCDLGVTVVPEPSIGGLFRNIRPSSRDRKEITAFLDDEGVLEIYINHPLIKKYMKGNYRNKPDFLIFMADTITREVIRTFVRHGIYESSSRFHIFDLDRPEPEIEKHVAREYYEQGPKLHDLLLKLVKTLK